MGNDAGLYAVRKSYPFPGAVASRRTRGRTWYCEEDFLVSSSLPSLALHK
jgi:hypothetical protein